MSKKKVSVEDKIYAVNLYLDGKENQRRIVHSDTSSYLLKNQ